MSAISVFVNDDGIVFGADAAMYDTNGVVRAFVPKLYLLPGNDGICSSVGVYGFLDEFRARTSGDFDEVVEQMVQTAKDAYKATVIGWGGPLGWGRTPRATLILGGISKSRQKFEVWKLHSSEKAHVHAVSGEEVMNPAWTPIAVNGLWASSLPKEEDLTRFGIDYEDENFNAIDMVARMVCANRAQSGPSDHVGVYGVGGRLDMALLYPGNLLMWTAHHWPDKVGEIIDPAVGELMPSFPLVVPWPDRSENET